MIVERAPAKINLALHVRARRDDGYHELETLFAFLTDGDEIALEAGASSSLEIVGLFAAGLAGEGDNLVTRAMKLYAESFGIVDQYRIVLTKNLPVASGIGGGSADAAATLRALARLHGHAPNDPRLFICAETLGSDVPACLLGRSALGTGRGEQLRPIDGVTGMAVLLVNPGVKVSTAAVFKAWDGHDLGGIGEGDLIERALNGRNDLEPPARALAPEIDEVLARLSATTPMLARMSGSGATCFALYADSVVRDRAAAAIRSAKPGWWCLESTLA